VGEQSRAAVAAAGAEDRVGVGIGKCSGLHLSAVGRDLIGLNRLTLAGIIGCVWLTLGDFGRTIGATGLHLSAPAHARWD